MPRACVLAHIIANISIDTDIKINIMSAMSSSEKQYACFRQICGHLAVSLPLESAPYEPVDAYCHVFGVVDVALNYVIT